MKIGIQVPNFGDNVASRDGLLRVTKASEDMGFDSVWVVDHTILPKPDDVYGYGKTYYQPFVSLGFIAGITNTIKIGTSILVVPNHNPIILAKAISTADQLCDGRLICGIGLGAFQTEFEYLGIPFNQRGSRTDESLRIMYELWDSEDPHFKGRYWSFENLYFLPKPIQRPRPPIWVAGSSDAAIRRSVVLGDGWHPSFVPPETIKEGVDKIRKVAANENRNINEITISTRAFTKFTAASQGDSSNLIGTADEMIARIADLQAVGVSHIVIDLFIGVPDNEKVTVDDMLGTMEQLAEKVLPNIDKSDPSL